MRLMTFIAKDMAEALIKVRAELGVEAVIISSQRAKEGGVMVRAAVDELPEEAEREAAVAAFAEAAQAEASAGPQDFEQQYHRGLIRRLRSAGPRSDAAPARSFNRAELLQILRRHRTTDALAHALAEAAEKSNLSDMTLALASALDKRMATAPLELTKSAALLLTGPHGAGKTALAGKLASHALLAGRAVRLVAGDVQGAGAVERLRTFADHLDAPFTVAENTEALTACVRACAKDNILAIIDTAGFDPRNAKARTAFAALAGIEGIEAVGAISAAGDAEETNDIAVALTSLGTRRLIVTGLDLVRRFGALAAAATATPGLAHVTRSPFVAGALETLTPLSLARALIEAGASATGQESTP